METLVYTGGRANRFATMDLEHPAILLIAAGVALWLVMIALIGYRGR